MSNPTERHGACCKISTTPCPCPVCGNMGRKVTSLTLDNHVSSPSRKGLGNDVTFCLHPDCEVIYCNPTGKVVRRNETVLPVTIKDPGDRVYVCYCFKFKRGDIRRDLRENGKTNIPDKIRKGIQEGRCDCERKNPQGACCLSNVANAIKALESERQSNATS